jgi:O-antigen/teichoic acid export membrane protein
MATSVSSEAKVIAKHSAVYGLSSVLDRAVSFLMLPVYTRFLTPADYGIMELLYMTSSVISLVVGLGLESAVNRFYFDYATEEERKKVVSSAMVGYGGLILLVIGAIIPFSGYLAELILDSREHTDLFMVSLSSLAFGMVLPIFFAYIRVQQKSVQYLTAKVSATVATLGLNIYFVVYAKLGVMGILLSTLIVTLLSLLVLGILILRKVGLKFNFGLMKEMIRFGMPLIPSNISAYIVHSSDRYFVKEYVDMTATGLYSLGYKFGTLVNQFVTSPFIQIWSPRRMEYFGKEGYERIYARIFTYFCAVSLFVGLLISLLSKEVIYFMAAPSFRSAYKVVPIIVLAHIIFSFHYHFNVGILMKKATKYIAYVNISNGILNLILNFIMIKYWSIWGAAIATLICFIFKVSMTYYYSNRFYKIQMEWLRITVLFATSIALYFAGTFIETGNLYADIGTKAALGFSFPLLLYLLRFFNAEEIKRFKQIIKTRSLKFS